jgi:hypothetical protein
MRPLNRVLAATSLLGALCVACSSSPSATPDAGGGADTAVDTGTGADRGTDTGADVASNQDMGAPSDAADAAEADCTICTQTDQCLMNLVDGSTSTMAASCNAASGSTRANLAITCQTNFNLYCRER